jgi:hypothetical protein
VGRVVGVAERDRVVGDVVFTVLETTDRQLGFPSPKPLLPPLSVTPGVNTASSLKSAVTGAAFWM